MLKKFTLVFCLITLQCFAQTKTPTVKSILHEQLSNTTQNEGWFVPLGKAIDNLNEAQVNWNDKSGNHSIGQLITHLIFWNEREQLAFKGVSLPNYNEKNDSTFKSIKTKDWQETISKLDSLQSNWKLLIENATESQIKAWASEIANMCLHNAYHTGQIVYIRKQNSWWN